MDEEYIPENNNMRSSFEPSERDSNSFQIGSDPTFADNHKEELNRKQTAGSMINFITKKQKRNSQPKVTRARTGAVSDKVDIEDDAN